MKLAAKIKRSIYLLAGCINALLSSCSIGAFLPPPPLPQDVFQQSKQVVEKIGAKAGEVVRDVAKTITNSAQQVAIEPIKNFIKSSQIAIYDNPYRNNSARVRREADALSKEEESWRARRFQVNKEAQENFLSMKLSDDEVLEVGFAFSGGGARAALGTLGFLEGAQEAGLLDCVMSMAGISGSTWSIASWISSGRPLVEFKNFFLERLAITPVPTPLRVRNTVDNLLVKFAYEQPLSVIDLYGNWLGNAFLGNNAGIDFGVDANLVYLASTVKKDLPSQAEQIDRVDRYPFPIYTAVQANTKELFEFTPYEVGCRALKIYVPTWGFGRKFNNGVSIDNAPEQSLGFLMGIFGSALSRSIGEYYDAIKPMMNSMIGHFSNIPGFSQLIQDVVLDKINAAMTGSIGTERPVDAVINNFAFGISDSPLVNKESIQLVDAGFGPQIPLLPVYRKSVQHASPDIVFAFDFSPGPDEHGEKIINGLMEDAESYGIRLPIPFNAIDESKRLWGVKALTVFKNQEYDVRVPVLCYMPQVKDDELIKKYKDDARYVAYMHKLAPLDWNKEATSGYASTARLAYTKTHADSVVTLTKFNMLSQIEVIRNTMKERILAKREIKKQALIKKNNSK